jgi:DNA-binding NarL/FixJ family response regulator
MRDEVSLDEGGAAPFDRFLAARARICRERGVALVELERGARGRELSAIRRELAILAVAGLGLARSAVARALGVSISAVAQRVRR